MILSNESGYSSSGEPGTRLNCVTAWLEGRHFQGFSSGSRGALIVVAELG